MLASFPAAATNNISAVFACPIAVSIACEFPPPPQLLFNTRMLASVGNCAFNCTAKLIAKIAFDVLPLPSAARNFNGNTIPVQLIPVTPLPLFPAPAIVPATCVPCPLSSMGIHVFVIALKPRVPAAQVTVPVPNATVNSRGALHTFADKSGCVKSTPVSITPTITPFDPVVISQASVAPISAPGRAAFSNPHKFPKSGSFGSLLAVKM